MIEEVKEFRSEVNIELFGNVGALDNGGIEIDQARSNDRVPT